MPKGNITSSTFFSLVFRYRTRILTSECVRDWENVKKYFYVKFLNAYITARIGLICCIGQFKDLFIYLFVCLVYILQTKNLCKNI